MSEKKKASEKTLEEKKAELIALLQTDNSTSGINQQAEIPADFKAQELAEILDGGSVKFCTKEGQTVVETPIKINLNYLGKYGLVTLMDTGRGMVNSDKIFNGKRIVVRHSIALRVQRQDS